MTTQRPIAENHSKPLALGQGGLDVDALGTLWLVWSDAGLRELHFASKGHVPDPRVPITPPPAYLRDPLRRYFEGEPVDPASVRVDLDGTPFQRRVWGALRAIPRGAVRTYAGIAHDIGSPRAMRAVGMANARNPVPIVVPCHRVVESGSRLGGYSGGLEVKRRLLALEGVAVDRDVVRPGQLDLC